MQTKQDVIHWLEENQAPFIRMADEIWENPEIALQEYKASKLQAGYLENEGFTIRWGSGGMPTAFIATWGQGKPIIGFIGEYDALKNLSQKNQATQEPVVPGGLGQGCGHNLLGTGGLAAAVAVRRWLEEQGKPGTVRYYGCPAEEILAGKVYMARDGAFDDLDAALNFHPSSINSPNIGTAVALNNLKFRFFGKAAHAGASPHLGRSALDAVELMNVGVNYLREHVPDTTRIHYVITNGGDLPNIVPAEAEVWYFVRAPERAGVDEITERVRKIAQGAALMTDTRWEEEFITGCSNTLNNHALADLQYRAMQEIGPIDFTPEEKEYARTVNEAFPPDVRHNLFLGLRLPPEMEGEPLLGENYPGRNEGEISTGSSDIGDVSWITPLCELNTACHSTGAPGHSWGIVATGGMSIGHKGMLHAAKIMALAAMDLYSDPEQLRKARAEFEEKTKDHPYRSPLPPGAKLKV
ncbi:MAG: M20 family metallopeptidase [Chloroflexi bacterium]|nr:M20 family metallopeptidase [Chloroflexota bacterium]